MYIKTDTLEYPLHEGDIRLRFSNTSFATPFTAPEGYAPVQPVARPVTDHTLNVTEATPENSNGVWTQKWNITAATSNEITARTAAKAAEVRAERGKKLAACDWTQIADSPVTNKAAWIQYRQDLRDISKQASFPWSVVWPVSP